MEQETQQKSEYKRVVALAVDESAHSETALDCKLYVFLLGCCFLQ